MKVIGITGGIGSGKSLVAKLLKDKYHAYIADSDGIAKKQMEPGGVSYQAVVNFLGEGILSEDGTIDRNKLAEHVFADSDIRIMINKLTHPNVLQIIQEEIEIARGKGEVPYFIIETALMIESGYDYICDEVWYVKASSQIRRSRLKKHRGYSDEKITTIFESQSKEEDFIKRFPIVIVNDGDLQQLEEQVDRILGKTVENNKKTVLSDQ